MYTVYQHKKVCTKFEEGRSRRPRVIDWKRFKHNWPRWPWPAIQNSIGFPCYPGWVCGPSLSTVGRPLGIDRKWKVCRQTDRPTNRHVQSNMPSVLRRIRSEYKNTEDAMIHVTLYSTSLFQYNTSSFGVVLGYFDHSAYIYVSKNSM